MPTIDELAPATAAADTDELIVSQSGIARKVTRAQVLSGVQPALSIVNGSLLGRQSVGAGEPEQIAIGTNLVLSGGTLSAAAAPFAITSLSSGNVPSGSDQVALGQSGNNVSVSYAQFLNGLNGVAGVDGSQLIVTPTGMTVAQRLADFVAGTLPVAGGSLTGPLTLAAAPTSSLQAATKAYVDTRVLRSGDAMTGPRTLAADPSSSLHAATKEYVDARLLRSGDTLTGPLTLAADPTASLQAASKQYVDTRVSRAGDTLTGPLVLAADPTASLQAATKHYVDTQVSGALPLTGGTLSGGLVLSGNPTNSLQAATKLYVDSVVAGSLPLGGGALTGPLTLSGNPSTSLQAATKQYVDTALGGVLPLTGGTLTGALGLPGNPATSLQAAPKQYIDSAVANALPLSGGTLTGALTLSGNPTTSLQAVPKQYVDGAVAGVLPLTGGTLTGSLSLSAAPITSMQAATKSYVDTRVVRSGDTMTGSLGFTQSYTGSAVPSVLTASRGASSAGDHPLVASSITVAYSGGGGYSNTNHLLVTNVGSVLDSNGVATDGPAAEVYSLVSYLNSTALRPTGVSPVAAQHVSIQSAPTRTLPPGGVPTGRQMAELWALWLPTVDKTNLPSSIANSLTANESDLAANNVDDANARFGLQLDVGEAVPLSSGGYPVEWAHGIYTTTTATGQFKWMLNLQGNYSIAVIDTRNAFPNGRAGPAPTVTTTLGSASKSIHVSNAMPFTSAGVYGQPVSSTNTAAIMVGSNTYTQVGCTLDGPGLSSGTLTFSSAVTVADGTAGNAVTNYSRTIWMGTGQQIGFDTAGAVTAFYDSPMSALHFTCRILADSGLLLDAKSNTSLSYNSAAFGSSGGATLQGNLMVTSTLYCPNNLTVGGLSYLAGPITATNTATFQSAVTMSSGLTVSSGTLTAKAGMTVSGGPIVLPIYPVTGLPAVTTGGLVYVSNGRKVGEAAGAGTGVLAIGSNGQWISVQSGTAVTA
jgi:hypothetical protein